MREKTTLRAAGRVQKVDPGLRLQYRLMGRYTVRKYDRETGAFLGSQTVRNEISLAGKNEMIKLIIGSGGQVFSEANSWIRLRNASAVETAYFAAADAGYPTLRDEWPDPDSRKAVWRWSDISVDVYEAAQAEWGNGNVTFSTTTATGFGSKPNTQNWLYEYELTLAPQTGDEDAWRYQFDAPHASITMLDPYPGLERFLKRMMGTAGVAAFAESAELNTPGIAMRVMLAPENWGTYGTEILTDPVAAAAYWETPVYCQTAPEHDEVNASVEWVFSTTVNDGTWNVVQIYHHVSLNPNDPEDGVYPLWHGLESDEGTKPSGATWNYFFEIQFIEP